MKFIPPNFTLSRQGINVEVTLRGIGRVKLMTSRALAVALSGERKVHCI